MRYWSVLRSFLRIDTRRLSTTTMSKKIAVCQMTSIADKAANLQVVSNLISDAAKDGVQMVFFPEACDYISGNRNETVEWAEPILEGPTVNAYRELASRHKVWLSMGGIHEKDADASGKIFNTHIIINSDGDIVQTYRKLHLFDVEIPERNVRLMESDFTNPGTHIVAPVGSPIGKIGLATCYDMRFSELSTGLSILGAEVLLYPSAFTKSTGEAHWHVLLRARAIENQVYVIAAAQAGSHNLKRQSYGHGLVVSPWGEVLADCGDSAPGYKVVDISRKDIERVRENMPVFKHRRSFVYSLYCLSVRKGMLDSHKCEPKEDPAHPEPGQADPPRGLPDPPQVQADLPTDPTSDRPYLPFGHVRVPESCVFYKSKLSYAFVNLRCVTPGHVLVAPVRTAERNQDLTDEESDDFYRTIRLVQRLMESVHKTKSCTVTIQDGPDAGQTVKHLHCHIMPRKKGDFIENDLIYLELAKHDQFKSGHPAKPARSLQDMEAEAHILTTCLKEMLIIIENTINKHM